MFSRPGPPLIAAVAIVALGTALVSPDRLGLLRVPFSFLIAAWTAGRLVDRATGRILPMTGYPPITVLSIAIGVGIACLSFAAVVGALCGALWMAGLAGLLLFSFGLYDMIRFGVQLRPSHRDLMAAVGGVPLGLVWLIVWLWATIPPTFFDELVYHLVIPQRALATGELQALPWLFFTLMPHASDLLLAWGMAMDGDLGARATQVALWVACSLAVWGLAAAIAWPRPAAWAAPLVAGVLATSPTLWFLGTLPFAETCLATAVITAACVFLESGGPTRPWLAFGLLLGLAASVKLSGLSWVMAGLSAALVARWSRWDIIRVVCVTFAALAPWWARAILHTGNPIYPMAYHLFGGRYWNDDSQARLQEDLPPGADELGVPGLLRLPLDLVQHPERFGSASDVGVVAVVAGCLTLALPVLTRITGAGLRARQLGDAAAIFILVSGTLWVSTSTTTRFFAPALAFSLAVTTGMALLLGRAGAVVITIALLIAGAGGTLRFVAEHAGAFSSNDVALGRERPDDYLARQLDHHEAARFVREQVPANARLLFIGEARPYYFAREAVAPYPFQEHPLTRWIQESSSSEDLARRLTSEGITHVVLNIREFRRLHDTYRVLAFSGDKATEYDHRLKELPKALQVLFAHNGVYVFKVPSGSAQEK